MTAWGPGMRVEKWCKWQEAWPHVHRKETVLNASLRSQHAYSRAGTNMGEVSLYAIKTELNSTMRPGQYVTYQGCHERQGEFGCMHTLELSMGLHTHLRAAWGPWLHAHSMSKLDGHVVPAFA